MIEVWRVTKRKYSKTAFTGEGARLAGARFNRRGLPLVYTSGSLSLALLEVIAQVVDYGDLDAYVAIAARMDERLVRRLSRDELPEDWRAVPAPGSTRRLGSDWIRSAESPVLQVPSVVVPKDWNYLINPRHADFGKIEIGEVEELELDVRLWKG